MKYILPLIAIAFMACKPEPEPIQYGVDTCVYCKMTIVDRQHAAELVTIKGKAFKYDAIECMMNDLKEWEHPDIHLYLVNDYLQPGKLIDARKASFLISERIPSPMGEYLSAFAAAEERREFIEEEDSSFDWLSLRNRFSLTN